MSPQKRCSPRKKATPQKRQSPVKKMQSPAIKANRVLSIKRKVRLPSSRSLASAFGISSPSLNSPVSTSEIFTESMPAPVGSSNSNSALFPLELDNSPAPSRPTIVSNPFKRGSPLKKRRKTDTRPTTAFGAQIDVDDWDDSTANDSFADPATTRRKSIFTRTKSQMDTSALMSDYAVDFSNVLDSSIGSKNGSPAVKEVEEKSSDRLPLDNRLGTRLRIISPIPFPWMTDTAIAKYHVRITGQDQHAGTQLFVQSGLEDISKPCLSTSGGSSPSVLLTAACSYWQHPVLPWLPLFPRLSSQAKSFKDHSAPPLAPAMLKTINEQWSESLEALFLSWKKGDRHSFYVCCPNVTAHFTRIREDRRFGAGDESMSCFATSEEGLKHVVFLTPTTSGFRSYLREEGVQVETLDERGKRRLSRTGSFRMGEGEESRCSLGGDSSRLSIGSLTEGNGLNQSGGGASVSFQMGFDDEKENSKSGDPASRLAADECSKGEKSPDRQPNEEESEESGDETSPTKMGDAHDWLKTIGVSPASTLKMRRHHTALGRLTTTGGCSKGGGGTPTGAAKRFQREKSDGVCTVVVRDSSSVQAFYNLLLNSKSVRAIAGPHASLPPTLLAAQPFQRAQLQMLEKRSQILKRAGRGVEHVLEIDGGPIMPHAAQMACEFARSLLESNSTSTVPNASIHIRVNDRQTCNGFNSLLDEETGCDWTEMNVNEQGECKWT
ncbi:hypothetical protein PFISCL1PPCAC_7297, partial [Pristionchus fissidentatus]